MQSGTCFFLLIFACHSKFFRFFSIRCCHVCVWAPFLFKILMIKCLRFVSVCVKSHKMRWHFQQFCIYAYLHTRHTLSPNVACGNVYRFLSLSRQQFNDVVYVYDGAGACVRFCMQPGKGIICCLHTVAMIRIDQYQCNKIIKLISQQRQTVYNGSVHSMDSIP